MIVRETCGTYQRVRETGDANLQHVWLGVPVKLLPKSGTWVEKVGVRERLVRKAGCRLVTLHYGKPIESAETF